MAHDTDLRRSLSLWQVVLYGLGVTIGAGIYVLVGVAAGESGVLAPLAFLFAALMLSFTALSFAELATRMPIAASEAAYVTAGFQRPWLTLLTGGLVILTGAISAATVSVGAAGYVSVFIPAPMPWLIALVVVGMALIASLATVQSVTVAGLMTAIEIGGLLTIVGAGLFNMDMLLARMGGLSDLPAAIPWSGLLATSLIAVFAYIGFEHVVNIAEEVRDPPKTLPRALFLTLAITALLYVSVISISVLAVSPAELAASKAPLALVYERLTGRPLGQMSAVAIIATLNGIIVHMTMIARVLYGMARAGSLPRFLGQVNLHTGTPLIGTAIAMSVILSLALLFPLERLAQVTAQATLLIFVLINAALIKIRRRESLAPRGIFVAPLWVPYLGIATTLPLLAASLAS